MPREQIVAELHPKFQYYENEIRTVIAVTPSKKDQVTLRKLNKVLIPALLIWAVTFITVLYPNAFWTYLYESPNSTSSGVAKPCVEF